MYLLTYEQWQPEEGGPVWRVVPMHFRNEGFAMKNLAHSEGLARDYPRQIRNVELFERRGNDWIRIRPEEG